MTLAFHISWISSNVCKDVAEIEKEKIKCSEVFRGRRHPVIKKNPAADLTSRLSVCRKHLMCSNALPLMIASLGF